MGVKDEEVRAEYRSELEKATKAHNEKALEYEKLAIDYTASIFRTLTYLYGGALIALPAAVALFQVNVSQHKTHMLWGAGAFVVSLILVCVSQGFAFFTMARRSEAETNFAFAEQVAVNDLYYPNIANPKAAMPEAASYRVKGNRQVGRSNIYRALGIWAMWFSIISFLLGCRWGGLALIG